MIGTFSEILGLGKGIGGIVAGSKLKKSAKKISKYQEATAELRKEENKKIIQETYAKNYTKTIDSFIDMRSDLTEQALKTANEMTFQLSNIKGADVNESSFNYKDATAKVNSDFIANLGKIETEQTFRMDDLFMESMQQIQDVENQFTKVKSQIGNNLNASLTRARGMMTGGIAEAFGSAAKIGILGDTAQDIAMGRTDEVMAKFESWSPKVFEKFSKWTRQEKQSTSRIAEEKRGGRR